jgi:hypothetical protein
VMYRPVGGDVFNEGSGGLHYVDGMRQMVPSFDALASMN